ncbi:peptidoglycan/LPS O-acetylase OafA/YrhL [Marmoricola sp. URHA0025 HA25]
MIARAALGLLLGAWFGALARLWMRLIVVYPEAFSWFGTLVIIISAAIGGLGLGLVRGARLTGRSKLWRLAALLALPFLGAPMGLGVFLLSAVVGGWALAHRQPIWLAPVLAALWFAALPFIAYAVGDPDHHNLYDGAHYLSISVGLWTLAALLAVGGRELFARWPVPARP